MMKGVNARTTCQGLDAANVIPRQLRRLSTTCQRAHGRVLAADTDRVNTSGPVGITEWGTQEGSSEATALETPSPNGAAESMEEYSRLKKQLAARVQRAVGFLTLYITLQQGLVAGACTLTGGVAGFFYLARLTLDADSYTGRTEVPLMKAKQIENPTLRAAASLLAAYRLAVRPRFLIPVGLAAAVTAFNRSQEFQISRIQEFDMLLGFLCYKAGLFLALYDDIKPKFDPAKLELPSRPVLPVVADLKEDEDKKEELARSRKRH